LQNPALEKENAMKRSAVCLGIFVAVCGLARSEAGARQPRKPNPVYAPITDDPALPRVLLIGDSISIGYTLPTRAALSGKANVHRPPTNCGPTTRGLQQIDQWLGDSKWDVIHFNWGLHDLKYMDAKGGLTDPDKGKQQVPIDQYEKNLDQLVQRIKKTGATLIWASTTPVPEGSKGRVKGDAAKYNGVAKKVTDKHGVAVDDLYAFALPRLKEIQRPANVHFTPDGSKALAEQVAASILQALAKEKK
jgi:acyl-CoA thioesterase-1